MNMLIGMEVPNIPTAYRAGDVMIRLGSFCPDVGAVVGADDGSGSGASSDMVFLVWAGRRTDRAVLAEHDTACPPRNASAQAPGCRRGGGAV